MPKTIYISSQDAERAFYEALERGDAEAIMAVWAEDEEIACVHPGGPRLAGYADIRESWNQLFRGGARLRVETADVTIVQTPFAAVHTLLEFVSIVGDDSARAPVVATNVYVRGPLGWRMVIHHASPAPPPVLVETPKILH